MYTKNIVSAALPALRLLHGDNNGIFEIRILTPGKEPGKKNTYTGYFDNVEAAYSALSDFKISWNAAYVTLHEVSRSLFDRAPNKIIRALRGDSTGDNDIVRRRWVVLDFDPIRNPAVQPSTKEEKDLAIDAARRVASFCSFRGMPDPILADSGNGAHLLWRCDLPANSEIHKRFLIEIASKFNSPAVSVDLTIANASRIWKIYGTLSRKGEATQERPFRYAKIIHIPDEIEKVSDKSFKWLPVSGNESKVLIYHSDGTVKEYKSRTVEELPKTSAPADRKDGGGRNVNSDEIPAKNQEFDALAKLESWGLKTLPPFTKGDLTVHELETCPCERRLKDRTSALYVLPGGAVGFGCKHATCEYSETGGNKWKELRNSRETFETKKTKNKNDDDVAELLEGLESDRKKTKKSEDVDWEALGFSGEEVKLLNSGNKKHDNIVKVENTKLVGKPKLVDKPKLVANTKPVDKQKHKKQEPIDDGLDLYDDSEIDDKKPTKITTIDIESDIVDIDVDGILGDLAENPESEEPPNPPEDPEILRPVKITGKIVRAPDGRRMIDVGDDYNTIYNHVFDEVSRKEDVYVSQDQLAYVDTDKAIMVPYETGGLDRLAWRTCEFIKYKKTPAGFVSKSEPVPKRIIESLKSIDHNDKTYLREVNQVVKSPFFTSSGEFITEPGYNKDSKTYLIQCPDLEHMGDVRECLDFLNNIICDFPFQSDAERANFLGTWLTPLVRAMIAGPVPMTVIEANKRGTGKTKLAQIIQKTYGLHPEVGDLPKEEENMEKLMLSIIIEGRPIHLFDNVKHSVNSACLDRILTTGYYSGRLLGKSKNLHCMVLQLFIMTSNNTRLSEDMSRRFARVRLRTNLRNPERRSDIQQVDILNWVGDNRGKIISALAGLVNHWIAEGSPVPDSLPRMGSFESWRNVVGAILNCAGETEWMKNMEEAMNDSLIVDEWEQFVDHWYSELGLTTNLNSLISLCERKGIFGGILRGELGQKQYNLRLAILDKRDSVIGDYRISVEKNSHTKVLDYRLEKIDWNKTSSGGEPGILQSTSKSNNKAGQPAILPRN